ncbi:DUF5677 domain-containing protein [Pseudomonas moraviensis]|uniref:DUF5677 domain-containing protein n=1 Tax=Pseudomonas moraviensis TaxID=321662 RepID=UPI00080EA78E|nr:DUF5677 domain-containing protein [Pseudomonas moraviensis]
MSVNTNKHDLKTSLFRSLIAGLNLDAHETEQITKHFEENAEEFNQIFALDLYQTLNKQKDEFLAEHYDLFLKFRERLFETWKTPLVRLDSLLYICMETVEEIRRDTTDPLVQKTNKFDIATRLHARCVQVGNEISHLLHGVYADGAFARWRTLHESSTTTKFICEGNEDLATRFLDFQCINRFRAATNYNKCNELEFKSFDYDQIEEFKKEKDLVLEKHGVQFGKKYGWAREALGESANPTGDIHFAAIEEFVGVSFLRNFFAFANQYVHAGIDSIGFKLGTSMSNKDVLLTGPSNEGLTDPIQCTSLSLIYATEALLNAYPRDDSSITILVLWLWHDALKQEVVEASDALQRKGDALRRRESNEK